MLELNGRTVKALGSIASKEANRYALNDIDVKPGSEPDTTILDATDGRAMMRLTYPANGVDDGRIEPAVHKGAKVKDTIRLDGPDLSVETPAGCMQVTRNAEAGPYPKMDEIIPTGEPVATVRLGTDLLCKLLKAFSAMNRETGSLNGCVDGGSIRFELHGQTSPVTLRAPYPGDDGQEILAVIMPVSDDREPEEIDPNETLQDALKGIACINEVDSTGPAAESRVMHYRSVATSNLRKLATWIDSGGVAPDPVK